MTPTNDPARTAISLSTVAECPFSIADEYAKEYLERAEAGGQEAYIRVPWFVPLPLPVRRVRMTFGLHRDVAEGGRAHDEIRFNWASGTRVLPDFRGTIMFRIEGARTRVLIDGSYAAPLGTLGRWFDAAIGKRVARASLRDLAERIAAYLAARERAWRAAKA